MPTTLTKLMKAQQYFLIFYLQQPNNLMIDHDSNKSVSVSPSQQKN